jgi:hypothetical protein
MSVRYDLFQGEPIFFKSEDQGELVSATVKIVIRALDFEISVTIQVIGEKSNAAL